MHAKHRVQCCATSGDFDEGPGQLAFCIGTTYACKYRFLSNNDARLLPCIGTA